MRTPSPHDPSPSPSPSPSPDWDRIKILFDACTARPPAERERLLTAGKLTADASEELRSLLEHHDAALADEAAFLLAPAADMLAGDRGEALAARVGQRLGAWEIVRPLGAGGMGEVFEVRRADGRYEGRAAVKLLKRGMDSAAVLHRFAQERQALARLDHPHIARLLDAGASDDGLPYFVMAYIDGQPIDQAAATRPMEARLQLFLQLADAVAHAHRNLLVHRDLKPGNVLVDGRGQVKLLDFGIAKALDPLESPVDTAGGTTLAGHRPYTPTYASPEQVRGEPVSTATDIYSLGVLLYQLLTGTRPTGRHASTPAEVARSVLEETPTRPSRLSAAEAVDPQWLQTRRKLEGDLDNILLKALEKTPARRYASVDALAADVRAFVSGHPVAARAPSTVYVAGKFVRRHRVGTVLAGLALAAVLGSGAFAAYQAQRAEARFEDLRQLAHAVLFDYHNLVEPLVGATPVRKRLVGDALTYLDRLAQHAPDDRDLRREMGTAYRVVGQVQRNGYRRPHLGDTAGALRSYALSIGLLERLVADDPLDEASAYELALALSARAAVWGEDGDIGAARPALLQAADLFTRHLERDTPTLLIRLELARTHLRLADVSSNANDFAAAATAIGEARRTLDGMAALQPGHQDLPHVWVWVHGVTARSARARGDWAVVATELSASRQIMLGLLAREPDNARYLEDLAGIARWMLMAAAGQRDIAATERWGHEASERYADLVRRDPDDHIARGNHADALLGSAGQLAVAGAPARGQQRLDAIRQPLEAALARWHDQPDMRARAVTLILTEAQIEDGLGHGPAAMARITQAGELARRLASEFPDQPMVLSSAAMVSVDRAKLLAKAAQRGSGLAERAAAAAALRAAVGELEALQRRQALVPSHRRVHIDELRRLLRQFEA